MLGESQVAVWVELAGHSQPLVVLDLTVGRLFDDIAVPYQLGQVFFLDGAPVKPSDLRRIKLLRVLRDSATSGSCSNELSPTASSRVAKSSRSNFMFGWSQSFGVYRRRNVPGHQAYDQAIKPKLKDYLPNSDELLRSATTILVEALKKLGSA